DAEKLLKRRLQECGKGRMLDPAAEERVSLEDLFSALVVDYNNNARRSVATLQFRFIPLRAAFGLDRAVDVTADRIARYAPARLNEDKAQPATINRELAALRRAFRLAVEQGRLSSVPTIKLLSENNARQGFVKPGDFERIVAALPDYLKDAARFGYMTGWRRGEILTLEWGDVDREQRRITLKAEHSKNNESRLMPFVGPIAHSIDR